ncbi:E3 ubiquitin-protein ligase BRE1A-like [Hydra vulgaris]|uniref:E3 ubiquitin-protein ligase BRE1A-like n=1 Tax=Hydra vulgaris TaxID=6087 RepID=A0ABM4BPQ9_HYDVU
MPLTHAERQKKYRERQSEKFGEKVVKEKESKKRKERRLANLEAEPEKERQRKRKSRQKRTESKSVAVTSPPYKSVSTLGKAVKRAESALPKSPRKRAKVVQKLLTKMNEIPSPEKKHSKNALDALTTKLVLDFYQSDDISRQAPGKRDTIVVRLKNKKETVQKRHLYMNVSEAYAVFKSDYPEESVGKSKFASLHFL